MYLFIYLHTVFNNVCIFYSMFSEKLALKSSTINSYSGWQYMQIRELFAQFLFHKCNVTYRCVYFLSVFSRFKDYSFIVFIGDFKVVVEFILIIMFSSSASYCLLLLNFSYFYYVYCCLHSSILCCY